MKFWGVLVVSRDRKGAVRIWFHQAASKNIVALINRA